MTKVKVTKWDSPYRICSRNFIRLAGTFSTAMAAAWKGLWKVLASFETYLEKQPWLQDHLFTSWIISRGILRRKGGGGEYLRRRRRRHENCNYGNVIVAWFLHGLVLRHTPPANDFKCSFLRLRLGHLKTLFLRDVEILQSAFEKREHSKLPKKYA